MIGMREEYKIEYLRTVEDRTKTYERKRDRYFTLLALTALAFFSYAFSESAITIFGITVKPGNESIIGLAPFILWIYLTKAFYFNDLFGTHQIQFTSRFREFALLSGDEEAYLDFNDDVDTTYFKKNPRTTLSIGKYFDRTITEARIFLMILIPLGEMILFTCWTFAFLDFGMISEYNPIAVGQLGALLFQIVAITHTLNLIRLHFVG